MKKDIIDTALNITPESPLITPPSTPVNRSTIKPIITYLSYIIYL